MKTDKNILIAFILNLSFSIFEFLGGIFTGSIAILSDALHDLGDAISIGFSYFLEKKSNKKPDDIYTYGYRRYSVIGSVITTIVLLFGSSMVIYNSIIRISNPVKINYNGMILIGIIGVIVNFGAVFITREGDSLNQRAVNLHMLEDVLGWVVVLIGAIIMKFTDISIIDPIMSICVGIFIAYNAIKNLKMAIDVFLEKIPRGLELNHLKEHLLKIEEVKSLHHIHIWTMDGYNNYATIHIVTDEENTVEVKKKVREEFLEFGISHCTIEIEKTEENCEEEHCEVGEVKNIGHHHHHH